MPVATVYASRSALTYSGVGWSHQTSGDTISVLSDLNISVLSDFISHPPDNNTDESEFGVQSSGNRARGIVHRLE